MLFIAEQNRKEGGGKIQSTFSSVRIYIYIYTHSAERVSWIAFSEPLETGRLVSQPCARDDEMERSCVRSLLGRGDCAIAAAHATRVRNSILFRVLSNRRLKIFLPTIPL